jgi:hypothetical protein
MRVQTHQNPKVDEGPLQRECRGHVTSTLRSSGGEDISKKPADIALELQRHFACWQSLNLYIGRTRENNSLYLSAIVQRTIGQLRAKSPTSALLATVSIASTWIRSTRRQILRRLRLLAAGRRGGSNLLMKDQIRLIAKAIWKHRYYQSTNLRHRISPSGCLPFKMGLYRNVISQAQSIYLDERRKSSRVLSAY